MVLVTTTLEVKLDKVETLPLIVASNVLLTWPLAENTTVVNAPLDIVKPTLSVTNAFEFNPAIFVIAQLEIKLLVLVTTMLEVKLVQVETAQLKVVLELTLVRSLDDNDAVITVLQETIRPPLSVS